MASVFPHRLRAINWTFLPHIFPSGPVRLHTSAKSYFTGISFNVFRSAYSSPQPHCMNNVILQLILNYSYTALHFPLHSGQVLKSYCFPPLFSFFEDFFNQTKWGLKVWKCLVFFHTQPVQNQANCKGQAKCFAFMG